MCATVSQACVIHLLRNSLQSLGFDRRSLVVPYRFNDTVYLAWILKATRDYSYTLTDAFPWFDIPVEAVVAPFQV